jgi:hypothetical protein
MSTRNISWGYRQPVRRADNLTTFMCRLSRNLGASISWNPKGLSRPVMGLLYLLPTIIYFIYPCYVLKNVLKWRAFTHASVHPSTPIQVSQEKTPTNTHGIVTSTKIIKLRAIKGKEKSP